MIDGQIYTPPTGELVRSIATIRCWAVQFQGANWAQVADFLRFFGVNWHMRLRGEDSSIPEQLDVQDEDGLFHTVRHGNWIVIDDSEERYASIYSNRYYVAHCIPAV